MDFSRQFCLISDFDGTFTRREFYDLVIEHCGGMETAQFWSDYSAGKITHFDALAGIFAQIRCSEAEVRSLLRQMEPDPRTPEVLRQLAAAGWDTVLVSNGCRWYIDIVLENLRLAEQGLDLPVFACPGSFQEGNGEAHGLLMERPVGSRWFQPDYGVDKRSLVIEYQQRYAVVAFAGNGAPDYQAALSVPPELRFARGYLASRFDREGIPYQCFEAWGDVATVLTTAGGAASGLAPAGTAPGEA
jgi:2,3-diketo-5-methylthio-1-phosphopentane phosphatase